MKDKRTGFIALFLLTVMTGTTQPVSHVDNPIKRIALNERGKINYIAYQLGLFSRKDESSAREVIALLSEYKLLVSVGVGLPLGMLSGILANWVIKVCGYNESAIPRLIGSAERAGHDVCITAALLLPILIYTAITMFDKSASSDAHFYRRRLETFLKDWHKHKHLTPDTLEPLFQELYEHYLVYGNRLLFDDVLVRELVRKVAHLSIVGVQPTVVEQIYDDGLSVEAMINEDGDHQSVGYGGSSVR